MGNSNFLSYTQKKANMVRILSKRKYVAVYIITTLIFLVGVSIGWQVNNYLMSDVRGGVDELRAQLIGFDLRNKIIGQNCDVSIESILRNKYRIGNEVTELEERLGKKDRDVLLQKELYQLTELNTWIVLKDRKERCGEDLDLIFFFYSNEEENNLDKVSEDQGYILDDLWINDPSIVVFSFDVNTENPALESLIEIYNITIAPSIVINEEVYSGFRNLYQIRQVLE